MTKKSFLKKMSNIAVLGISIISLVPMIAYGANKTWSGYAATPGSSIYTESCSKVTTSSVIANYSSGSSDSVGAMVEASLSYSNFKDVTYYNVNHKSYNIAKNSAGYVEILNIAHETFGDCMTRVRYVTSSAGNHRGWWRPDIGSK